MSYIRKVLREKEIKINLDPLFPDAPKFTSVNLVSFYFHLSICNRISLRFWDYFG